MIRRYPGFLLIAACLAALALRVLVPIGWMPATTGAGFSLSLCSGTTLPSAPLLPADEAGPCDFSLALGPALLAAVLLLPLLALPLMPAPLPHLMPGRLRRHRPRPPGQGPPTA